jgi:hypothetical protein
VFLFVEMMFVGTGSGSEAVILVSLVEGRLGRACWWMRILGLPRNVG